MYGFRYVAKTSNWFRLSSVRLIASLFVSAALHVGALLMPVSQQAFDAVPRSGEAGLQVSISPVSSSVFVRVRPEEGMPAKAESDTPQRKWAVRKRGFAVVPVVEEAKLDSEINIVVDDAAVTGFLILKVEVGEDGVVEGSSVLYSELPDDLAKQIEQKFASANFKPASINGERRKETLLFRVDVD